jgi:arginyl-tRNA synthetase
MALTGEDQAVPFRQLARILDRFGYADGVDVVHLRGGLVSAEGRRLSSREGTPFTIDETVAEIAARLRTGKGVEDRDQRARVALAVYLLLRARDKPIAFSIDQCLREGGRVAAEIGEGLRLLRELPETPPADPPSDDRLARPLERWLSDLAAYPLVLDRAVQRLDPAPLLHYLTGICRTVRSLHPGGEASWGALHPAWRQAAVPAGRVAEHAAAILNLAFPAPGPAHVRAEA